MLTSEHIVLKLIENIYDASLNPALWPAFLEKFADSTSGTTTTIFLQDLDAQRGSINAAIRFDPLYQRLYEEYYSKLNVWLVCEGATTYKQGQIVIGQAYVPDDVLIRTEYYNDFLRRLNIFHTFGTPVIKEQSMLSIFTSLRPRETGPYGADESKLLSTLIPHLQRAMKLHHHLADLDRTTKASWNVLERLNVGVIVVKDKGKIVFANNIAEQIINQKDGIHVQNGGLTAQSSTDAMVLRKLVAEAIETSAGKGIAAGGEIHIRRPSLRRPYFVSVSPFICKTAEFPCDESYGIVFIQDSEKKNETSQQMLRHLFNFTYAEAKVAAKLLEGKSISEVAEEIQISQSTVRTQLKSLFLKTSTNRQSDLIRRLLGYSTATTRR